MFEPVRRGRPTLPSGRIYGTSPDIAYAGYPGIRGGRVAVRLSAVMAAFVLVWTLVVSEACDPVESAFIMSMLGFAWHAAVDVTWGPGK